MTVDLDRLSPQPKKLGQCGACPYREAGSPAICYSCSLRSIKPLAADDRRCEICDLPLEDESCRNPICGWGDRAFEWNFAIGMRAGVLKTIVDTYKFGDQKGWALILARLVVGFLDEHQPTFAGFDLIIPTPAFTGTGAERAWDHARLVIQSAADAAGDRWPFVTEPVLERTKAVPRFTGKTWRERLQIAAELRKSLRVVSADRVNDKSVLVYDDLFTEGLTLHEVGTALRAAGAASVSGISLMRQPFTRRPESG